MTEALRILGFASLLVSMKILTWTAMLGGLGLFTYAVIQPTQERTIAASLFALLIFLPSILIERRLPPRQQRRAQPEEETEAA